jgi:hypothetical protein
MNTKETVPTLCKGVGIANSAPIVGDHTGYFTNKRLYERQPLTIRRCVCCGGLEHEVEHDIAERSHESLVGLRNQ